MKRMALGVLMACHGGSAVTPTVAAKIDSAGMDRTIAPGDDFYAYANGSWLNSHEIPADRAVIGADVDVYDETQRRIADLIKNASGAEGQKIGDFYASYMDEATLEKKGLSPIAGKLAALAEIEDATALARALGETLRADVDVLNATQLTTSNLFGLWIAQDLDNPAKYSAFLLQGGLSLPSRDYYLGKAERMTTVRDKFKTHVATVLKLAQIADADDKAVRIVELETKIAEAHANVVDSEDVHKNAHWDRAKLPPGLDWNAFLDAAGLGKLDVIVAWQPEAIAKLAALVKSEPIATWREWMIFHAIEHRARALSKPFDEERFAFYGTVLAGVEKDRERWKNGVDLTSAQLGEPVGKLYVAKYFPPSEKARAEQMVKNELAAFARRIDNLTWMTPATKAKAKAKLAVLKVGVGYPDKWRDYSGLEIKRDDLVGNLERAELFEYKLKIGRLGTPVDRDEWVMTPQTVNAVNLPAMNALNFPAAIMQPPFFDPNQPLVMDYGAMGSVIGHEISHSFDNTGADFDASGRLLNWWTPEDLKHFMTSAALLSAQYSAYKPFADLAVNGEQTLGENIADTAGLTVAYEAYRNAYGSKQAPTIDGFTGDQQFFIAFAQAWRAKVREQALRNAVLTDGHSPVEYRGDTVRNLDAWYPAFHVEPGQKLFLAPAQRAQLW
jgi:putative endopeptidase